MSFQVRKLSTSSSRRSFPWGKSALAAITILRPLVQWYGAWKKRSEQEQKHHRRVTVLKRALLILLAVLLSFVVLAGTVRALVKLQILNLSSFATLTGVPLPQDEDGFTNILLLGQGDASHDGQDLTDSIMVVSIDPEKTKSVALLSLPRDLYFLKTEKMSTGRINSLYRDCKYYLIHQGKDPKEASEEALLQLKNEIGRMLDLPIHHVVKIDFIGFEKAVDAIGGVDVVVPEAIVDSEYPDENYGYQVFSVDAGLRHFDGPTALKYARSRHTSSDFDRSARQQLLISALGEKMKSEGIHKNPKAILELLKIFSENVEMTMSVREVIALAALADGLDRSRIISMQLSDRNGLYGGLAEPGGLLYAPPREEFGGASVLLPVSLPPNPVTWKQIQTFSALLFQTRGIYLDAPALAVLNGGARPGMANVLGTELVRYGFNLETVGNAKEIKRETSFIAAASPADTENAEFFSTLLGIPIESLPADLPAEETGPVTIVLGKDYDYVPLQNLLSPP